jgi:hypothetical protein
MMKNKKITVRTSNLKEAASSRTRTKIKNFCGEN